MDETDDLRAGRGAGTVLTGSRDQLDAGDAEQSSDPTDGRDQSERGARNVFVGRLVLWVSVPLASAIWVAANSTRYYPVWDEWVMFDRATTQSVVRGLFLGFNGHMWSLASVAYNLQTHLFDVQGNWLAPALLVASLVALQLSMAGTLFRLGVPTALSLAAATLLAYFGPASETMVYQHLFGYNFALAFSFAAAFVAVGKRRDQRTAIIVAVLLLVALACDSANATGGLLFTGAVVIAAWPFRLALVALVPPIVGHMGWFLLDRSEVLFRGPCPNCGSFTESAPVGDSIEFGWGILSRSAGGLVTGSAGAGVLVLLLASGVTVVGLAMRRIPRPVIGATVGGAIAAVTTTGLLAYSRTGYWATVDEAIAMLEGTANRYLQPAAIFLMLGFLPAIVATVRPASRTAARALTIVATGVLVLIFAVNLGNVWPTRDFYRAWSTSVKGQVQESVSVITEGCAPGERLDRDAEPVDASYQIKVWLIEDLLDRGALDASFGREPSPELRSKICRPS